MKPLILLLLSASLVHAQTTAADRTAAAFKAAKTKLDVQYQADMAKKPDKKQITRDHLAQIEGLEKRFLPAMFEEIGAAQKAGDTTKEEALKKMLENTFNTKIGVVLTARKLLDVPSQGETKLGNFTEGERIQFQFICGVWTPGIIDVSKKPDDTISKESMIVLVHRNNSGEEKVIETNINHTRDKPFVHEVKLRGTYFLRIYNPALGAWNHTVYRLVTEKK